VALSSGLLTAILIVALAANTVQVTRLGELIRLQAETELQAATLAVDLQRLTPHLESAPLKFVVTHDLQYVERIREVQRSFELRLAEIESLELSAQLREESDLLRRLWENSTLSESTLGALQRGDLSPDDEELLAVSVRSSTEGLRTQLERVTEAARKAIVVRAERTFEATSRAQTYSWIVVAASLTFAVPVFALTLWSIREPLRRLEEGTRSVARGIYSYARLDESPGDEFADIATSFNAMVTRLGELDQMKRDFLSHISHELRTPLVAMDETNRLLLEEIPGPLTDKQRKLLDLNLEGSRRLADLISKLLDLARMEEHAVLFELQTNDLVELVSNVADSFLARAREMGLSIAVAAPEQPILADCDRDRIIQLVGNLIDNALKYSPAGSSVDIRVLPAGELHRPTAQPTSTLAAGIQVADSGPGVPDAEKEKIFKKFHQVGRPRTGGVGLGLAICTQIVDAHRGAIWVEDRDPSGSVFCVSLPIAHHQMEAQAG
jgi:two-component system sensor histidine kinase GlrK